MVYRVAVNPSRDIVAVNPSCGIVAVKRIWNSGMLEEKLEKLFLAEVKTLSSIRHSKVVKLRHPHPHLASGFIGKLVEIKESNAGFSWEGSTTVVSKPLEEPQESELQIRIEETAETNEPHNGNPRLHYKDRVGKHVGIVSHAWQK
jgi:hypothetical protein